METLTNNQQAFIKAYSGDVAMVDDEQLIEFLKIDSIGGCYSDLDSGSHMKDSWCLWNSAIAYAESNISERHKQLAYDLKTCMLWSESVSSNEEIAYVDRVIINIADRLAEIRQYNYDKPTKTEIKEQPRVVIMDMIDDGLDYVSSGDVKVLRIDEYSLDSYNKEDLDEEIESWAGYLDLIPCYFKNKYLKKDYEVHVAYWKKSIIKASNAEEAIDLAEKMGNFNANAIGGISSWAELAE